MNVCRGNFGAFVIGEKLYAVGGSTDNNKILEIVCIYVTMSLTFFQTVFIICVFDLFFFWQVECYKEGSGWEVCDVKAIGKRSHFSAIVM